RRGFLFCSRAGPSAGEEGFELRIPGLKVLLHYADAFAAVRKRSGEVRPAIRRLCRLWRLAGPQGGRAPAGVRDRRRQALYVQRSRVAQELEEGCDTQHSPRHGAMERGLE